MINDTQVNRKHRITEKSSSKLRMATPTEEEGPSRGRVTHDTTRPLNFSLTLIISEYQRRMVVSELGERDVVGSVGVGREMLVVVCRRLGTMYNIHQRSGW